MVWPIMSLRTTWSGTSLRMSLMLADEPPHQIHSYTLLFSLSITSSASSIHLYTPLHWCNHMQTHTHLLHRTDLTYLMDTWFTIHMFLLLFLVSPTCALPWSDQSWALAPHGQALHFGWALCSLSCWPFIFNFHVFTIHSKKPQPITYMSFPQNWDLALTPCTISHCIAQPCNPTVFTLHHTWRWSLAPRSQPQSPIWFILRSPAP